MPKKFKIQRRIEFHESDAAGIVHFSKVGTWVESAERKLLEESGIEYYKDSGNEISGFPKAAFSSQYHHPIEVNDTIEVDIWIVKIGNSSIQYNYSVSKQDNTLCVSGELVSIFAQFNRTNKEICTQEVPKTLRKLLLP